MRKRAVLLLGVISTLLNVVVGCVEEVRLPVTYTPPLPTLTEAPALSTKADLIDALEGLQDAMLKKIDWDIDNTALAFTTVKDYWRTKRWVDIIRAPLRVIEATIDSLAKASDLKSLAGEVDEELIKAKATYQVLTTVMMVQDLREVGGKLHYGLYGPSYVSAIESMLDTADATTEPPLSFSKKHYKMVIENHLLGTQGEPVVKIPRHSTKTDRKVIESVNGALQVKTSIKRTFDRLIADIEAGELPEEFPVDEVVSQLEYLRKKVLKSTLHGVNVVYRTHFSDYERTTLGAVADRKEAWHIAAGNLDNKLDIEYEVELQKAGNALLITFTYICPGADVIKVSQQVTTLAELLISSYEKTFHTDPEEAFYMLPQEMLLTLPNELSSLWMIADDTDQYLRHLLVAPPSPPLPTPSYYKGAIAYVAAEDDLWVIDISDPANPHKIGHCSTPYSALGVFASGSYAYLADGYADLRVIDVSDPTEPEEVGHSDIPKGALDVFVSGSYAYVIDRGGFLHAIDTSSAAKPRDTGYCDVGGLNVIVSGSYAYVATGHSLRMIDVSEPSNPIEVGCWGCRDPSLFVFDVYVSNDFAYVVTFDGLRVIDVSDPANPYQVGGLDMPGLQAALELPSIFVSGSYAYVATTDVDGQAILWVIDVSYPTDPYEVGYCNTPGQPEDIFVLGSYAYLAAGTAGLRVIDISDPSNPYEVGYWDDMPTLAHTYGVFVSTGMPAPTPTPRPMSTPTSRPYASKIAYVHNGDIWLINEDGSGKELFVREGARPVWSPDGRKIAYVRSSLRQGVIAHEIRVAACDRSSDEEVFTVTSSDFSFRYGVPPSPLVRWSHDGKGLFVITSVGLTTHRALRSIPFIYVDLATRATAVVDDSACFGWFDISPINGDIVYEDFCNTPGGDALFQGILSITDQRGTGRRLLLSEIPEEPAQRPPGYFHNGPAWSPDGEKIAFYHGFYDGRARVSVWIINADGENLRQLVPVKTVGAGLGPIGSSLCWSPDGKKIAYLGEYTQSGKGRGVIWIVNSDGTGSRELVEGYSPSWAFVPASTP